MIIIHENNPIRFVVIFKAKIKVLDSQYLQIAHALRDRAIQQFNCQKFESLTESDTEIALSYWCSLEDIQAWHLDAEHQVAQRIGKEKWYKNFSVEICEVIKSYQSNTEKSNIS